MVIPQEKLRLLKTIVASLAGVRGLDAIALGGSHARGTHTPQSDLDIGLYYREAQPFSVSDVRKIAAGLSKSGSPIVTEFYEWGPFVNGGAWIDNAVCKIDFLYRNLDQLERIVGGALEGVWTHSFDQQPPFGFRSVTIVGEIQCCKPLHDPPDILSGLKSAVAIYPPKLKMRIVQDTLWCAEFSFQHAKDFAKAGDVPNAVGCMTRIFHYLVQALFALNETYFVNDKRVLTEIEGFRIRPADFERRISAIMAAPGGDPETLAASLQSLRALFAETVAIADGLYQPKFPTAPD
jgi:predicted nucleotidyltransferase